MKPTMNMSKPLQLFRLLGIAALLILAAISGPSPNLVAQSGSVATVKRASFQQQAFEDEVAADKPVNLTPSTGLITDGRLNSIHKQLDLLKELVEKDDADREKARQAELEKMNAVLKPQPPVEISNKLPATDPEIELPATKAPPLEDATQQVSGTPVVAKPINPFKLASSLFRTGNIAASRKSYQSGLGDAEPAEKVWLNCLIACCYRLEGNYETAETIFRDVTNQREDSYAVDYAKWSLDYVDRRRNAAQQFEEIELEIDGIMNSLKQTKSRK